MKAKNALRALAEVSAYQWGMVTSAQARTRGASRLDLSRLADAGNLERLAHGVYKDSGAPSDPFDGLYAAWLSTDPKSMGEDRLQHGENGVVVAGASAARLHDIGDLWADRHDFVAPTRRQTQRAEIRYRQRSLDPHDVTLAHGLPVMTIERTIADLVEDVGGLSLVADVLRDAALRRSLDFDRLRDLLAPLAGRNGLKQGDGDALLDRLLEIAEIDVDTLTRRVAADDSLGPRIAASYVSGLTKADLDRLLASSAAGQVPGAGCRSRFGREGTQREYRARAGVACRDSRSSDGGRQWPSVSRIRPRVATIFPRWPLVRRAARSPLLARR